MSALDLARWQFGVTTLYHFLFVPLTIGLARSRRTRAPRRGAHRAPA
ncbi:MAG TPA: cytochrome ubiquinol oxidase subunit I [Gaiellaceae bacterium]|nr:cytochrome ubiquinol oxidase subunit I [Gaiellaceae bacterium]